VDVVKRKFLPLPGIKQATLDAVKKQKLLPLPRIKPQFQKCGLQVYFNN
jgi:hypothetical protein